MSFLARVLRNVDATKIAGSAYCTAPECLHKVAPYSPAADIFAFGLLVCELITRLVNNGSTIPRTAEFGLDRDSLPVSQDCPAWFLELAVDCCKVEHQERPSVEDIVDRIMQHSLDRQAASPLPVNCSRAFALASGEKRDCTIIGCAPGLSGIAENAQFPPLYMHPPLAVSAGDAESVANAHISLSDCVANSLQQLNDPMRIIPLWYLFTRFYGTGIIRKAIVGRSPLTGSNETNSEPSTIYVSLDAPLEFQRWSSVFEQSRSSSCEDIRPIMLRSATQAPSKKATSLFVEFSQTTNQPMTSGTNELVFPIILCIILMPNQDLGSRMNANTVIDVTTPPPTSQQAYCGLSCKKSGRMRC
ncbi:unnamed protein product [Mesocestoides corti]|uniref:Protein kinase domain-containing protein n=1 Tax=Mesocestoides corti TaxID=53468 RepID=A0A0R3UBW6_MESCO|nr:unnamed protein product [Mesocestoides corti]